MFISSLYVLRRNRGYFQSIKVQGFGLRYEFPLDSIAIFAVLTNN